MHRAEGTEKLYGFIVEEVDGNSVRPDAIAETYIDKRLIRIPNFSHLSGIFRANYRDALDRLKGYILGHEVEVEAKARPGSEEEHSAFERNYLESLREKGALFEYLFGLVTHKMRHDNGDETGFTERIWDNYIEPKLKEYGDIINQTGLEEIATEALMPVRQEIR